MDRNRWVIAWLAGAMGAVRTLGALRRSGRRVERRAWKTARRIGPLGVVVFLERRKEKKG